MDVKNPLNGVPRQLASALGDLGRIAEGMETLPALLEALQQIEKRTTSLDAEVKSMRKAVERLEDRVREMDEGLEGKLDDVASALHPVRRAFRRGSSS
jgi:phage shock protein A